MYLIPWHKMYRVPGNYELKYLNIGVQHLKKSLWSIEGVKIGGDGDHAGGGDQGWAHMKHHSNTWKHIYMHVFTLNYNNIYILSMFRVVTRFQKFQKWFTAKKCYLPISQLCFARSRLCQNRFNYVLGLTGTLAWASHIWHYCERSIVSNTCVIKIRAWICPPRSMCAT